MGQSEGVADVRVVLAVDGNSLVHRAYHAAASSASALTEPVWAVRGLLTQIVAGVERVGADAVVVGFDDAAASVRRETWPQYKEHRTEKSQCLVDQLSLAAEVLFFQIRPESCTQMFGSLYDTMFGHACFHCRMANSSVIAIGSRLKTGL